VPANKLFRAIVVMGASLTTSSCDDPCHKCVPAADANPQVVDARPVDAGVDTQGPRDAEVDTVLIL
jgi:hypothetical protein